MHPSLPSTIGWIRALHTRDVSFHLSSLVFKGNMPQPYSHLQPSGNETEQILIEKEQERVKLREERWSMGFKEEKRWNPVCIYMKTNFTDFTMLPEDHAFDQVHCLLIKSMTLYSPFYSQGNSFSFLNVILITCIKEDPFCPYHLWTFYLLFFFPFSYHLILQSQNQQQWKKVMQRYHHKPTLHEIKQEKLK